MPELNDLNAAMKRLEQRAGLSATDFSAPYRRGRRRLFAIGASAGVAAAVAATLIATQALTPDHRTATPGAAGSSAGSSGTAASAAAAAATAARTEAASTKDVETVRVPTLSAAVTAAVPTSSAVPTRSSAAGKRASAGRPTSPTTTLTTRPTNKPTGDVVCTGADGAATFPPASTLFALTEAGTQQGLRIQQAHNTGTSYLAIVGSDAASYQALVELYPSGSISKQPANTERLTVNGRTAYWGSACEARPEDVLMFQWAAGKWATVGSVNRSTAVSIAEALEQRPAQPMRLPFRLAVNPADARVLSVGSASRLPANAFDSPDNAWGFGTVELKVPGKPATTPLSVQVIVNNTEAPVPVRDEKYQVPGTVLGGKAEYYGTNGLQIYLRGYTVRISNAPNVVEANTTNPDSMLSRAELVDWARKVRIADDPRDTSTWYDASTVLQGR